jgi:hypothetical protein
MWGSGTGGYYLHRISAKGRMDTEFKARTGQTLANVRIRGGLELGSMVLVLRPRGLLDLYGGSGLLRLRANGLAERPARDGPRPRQDLLSLRRLLAEADPGPLPHRPETGLRCGRPRPAG